MRDKYADLPDYVKAGHFKKLNKYKESLRKDPKLKSLFIEATLRCNEHCVHCGSNCGDLVLKDEVEDKQIIEALEILKEDLILESEPLPFISVTGGEPLLRKGLCDMMRQIHDMGYKWGMTTNGTLITEEVAKGLKNAGMYSVSISLDGYGKTHDEFRQKEGAYEEALKGFDNLIKAEIPVCMITTVVHKKNIGELDSIYEELVLHKVKNWRIINVEPIGRACKNKEIMLDSKDYKYVIDYIASRSDDANMDVIYSCNHYLGLPNERKVRPWYFFCRAGIQVASIQYNGDICACLDIERRPEFNYGNIKKDRIYDVWKNGFRVFREHKEEKSEMCKKCPEKENCQGGGYHTWDFETNNPRICMPKELDII
ncbi:MAG: radical SAM protein [Lachnospiraceae bacterium]|nr:radical SAM protein [Lachnospiraceae bacterium]